MLNKENFLKAYFDKPEQAAEPKYFWHRQEALATIEERGLSDDHLWTIVDGEDLGAQFVMPGDAETNQVCYLVTDMPHHGGETEPAVWTDPVSGLVATRDPNVFALNGPSYFTEPVQLTFPDEKYGSLTLSLTAVKTPELGQTDLFVKIVSETGVTVAQDAFITSLSDTSVDYSKVFRKAIYEDGSPESDTELVTIHPENDGVPINHYLVTSPEAELVIKFADISIPVKRTAEHLTVADSEVPFNRPATLQDVNYYIPALKQMMPQSQLALSCKYARDSEEGQFFKDKLVEMGRLMSTMPQTREQDHLGDEAIAYLHYFGGNCDFYVTEKDMEPDQYQAFGVSDIGDGPEIGYINLEELKAHPLMQVDFHFKFKTIGEIMSDSYGPSMR